MSTPDYDELFDEAIEFWKNARMETKNQDYASAQQSYQRAFSNLEIVLKTPKITAEMKGVASNIYYDAAGFYRKRLGNQAEADKCANIAKMLLEESIKQDPYQLDARFVDLQVKGDNLIAVPKPNFIETIIQNVPLLKRIFFIGRDVAFYTLIKSEFENALTDYTNALRHTLEEDGLTIEYAIRVMNIAVYVPGAVPGHTIDFTPLLKVVANAGYANMVSVNDDQYLPQLTEAFEKIKQQAQAHLA